MNIPKSDITADLPSIGRESDLLRVVEGAIESRLPAGWQIQTELGPRIPGWRPDAIFTLISPGGQRGSLLVEARLGLEPREIDGQLQLLEQASIDAPIDAEERGAPMIVSRFISPRAKTLLEEAGACYADATGNMRLVLDRPAIFLSTEGKRLNPWRETRDLRSLRGRTASRLVRALCDLSPPFGVRDLAERSGTSLGSASRTVDFLYRDALIERDPRKQITRVLVGELVERWARDFKFSEQNEIVRGFEPRRLSTVLDLLRDFGGDYAITGSFAANALAPYAEPRLLTIYAADLSLIQAELGIRQAGSQSNVWLAQPKDDLPFVRTWERDGLRYAAPSQVACDLFDMPGRSPQEAEEILRRVASGEELGATSL